MTTAVQTMTREFSRVFGRSGVVQLRMGRSGIGTQLERFNQIARRTGRHDAHAQHEDEQRKRGEPRGAAQAIETQQRWSGDRHRDGG